MECGEAEKNGVGWSGMRCGGVYVEWGGVE